MEPLLRMSLIRKKFPGVQALDDAGLEMQPDSGTIEFGGENVVMASPHDAQRRGIATIYQEFTLAPNMTIAENVFIGREPGPGVFVDWGKMASETRTCRQLRCKADRLSPRRDITLSARSR